jgi:hypothetical protein
MDRNRDEEERWLAIENDLEGRLEGPPFFNEMGLNVVMGDPGEGAGVVELGERLIEGERVSVA